MFKGRNYLTLFEYLKQLW